jgi:hypothetical protein
MSQASTPNHRWSQTLAGAALSILSSTDQISAQSDTTEAALAGQLRSPGSEVEVPKHPTPMIVTAPTGYGAALTSISEKHSIIAYQSSGASPPRLLPSFLRYVDGELMLTAAAHNHPPQRDATCSFCSKQWNTAIQAANAISESSAITSTFLPLSPCGHWIHYRCLIWIATQFHEHKNRCHECGTHLFQWEGITALTLATRTGLDMEDGYRGDSPKLSDSAEYESECASILSLIHAHFFTHLAKVSKHADSSPDLVQCFYDVLDALQRMAKPQARWLQYSTQTGYLLFGMLVTIKMRRYLLDGHARIQGTLGWNEFEKGRKTLQDKILAEVHAA